MGLALRFLFQADEAIQQIIFLQRNHAVRPAGHHGAGHDFYGECIAGELHGRGSRRLDTGDPILTLAACEGIAMDGNSIHAYAVERRVVAFRVDVLAQRLAYALFQRSWLSWQGSHAGGDCLLGRLGCDCRGASPGCA